jgi:hypothetical protein
MRKVRRRWRGQGRDGVRRRVEESERGIKGKSEKGAGGK